MMMTEFHPRLQSGTWQPQPPRWISGDEGKVRIATSRLAITTLENVPVGRYKIFNGNKT